MTLKENKKITLALIEEYAPNLTNLTEDEDIAMRINLLYAPAYQELATIKKIIEKETIREIGQDTSSGFVEYELPEELYQLNRLVGFDEELNSENVVYKKVGKSIYYKNDKDIQIVLEYYKYPEQINEDTADDFELELDLDVQNLLPYAVANDILKNEPSANYTAFLNEYQRKLNLVNTADSKPSVVIVEGIL